MLGTDTELTRVLHDVLGNAVRHSPSVKSITMSAGSHNGVGWLHVDDGCGGIPDSELPRLFELGYRGAPARTPSQPGGAGLGLSIAQGLIRPSPATSPSPTTAPDAVTITLALAGSRIG